MNDTILNKLNILSNAAKYDVSCSSSGSNRSNNGKNIGNTVYGGICHSFTEDGIRIAFCVTNKTADKAGLLADDIILQLAEFPIIDFDDYMLAMNKLQKGREIPVTVKRGKNEFKFFVVL
jgi:S1-C subfamily serine protease